MLKIVNEWIYLLYQLILSKLFLLKMKKIWLNNKNIKKQATHE